MIQRKLLAVCLLCGLLQADNNLCKYEIYTNLKTLVCPPNTIKYFPSNIHNDTQFLRLAENRIQSIPSNLSLIVPNLEKIDLSNNPLTKLPAETFKDLKLLSSVNVLQTNVSSLEANIFQGVQASYVHLNLGGNSISNIDKNAFAGLYGETSIDLARNRISKIDENTLSDLRNLIILKLGRNNLQKLPSKLFTNQQKLFYLDLQSNNINLLTGDVFKGLTALETLFLNGNKLKSLPNKLFDNTKLLKRVLLEDNEFNYPPENLPLHIQITLSRNPLHCDCALKKMLSNTSLVMQISDLDELTCNNSRSIKVVEAISQMDCTPTTTTAKPTTTTTSGIISNINDTTNTTTQKEEIIEDEGTSKPVVILVVVLVILTIVIVGAIFLYLCRRNVNDRLNQVRNKLNTRRLRTARLHSSADDIVANSDQGETKTPMFVKTEIDV